MIGGLYGVSSQDRLGQVHTRLLSLLLVSACSSEPPAPVVADEPPLAHPDTADVQALRWLAKHPDVTAIVATVLPDHHWMIRVDTATSTRRCVHATKPTPTRACWSGRTSEILIESFIPLPNRTDMRLLERHVDNHGATTTRWLRFPGAVWSPAAVHEEPQADNTDDDTHPSWYPRPHEQTGVAQLPRADVRWMSMHLDVEPLDVTALEGWQIGPVSVHAPGTTAIQLLQDRPDDRYGLLCVRLDAQWRCSNARGYGPRDRVDHDFVYPLGDMLVVQRSVDENGSVSGTTTLEILTRDNLLLTRVGALQIGAMLATATLTGEYGARRAQLYMHRHSPRGTCIAIEPPVHEHVELEDYMFKKRSLPGGQFTRTPVPDRLELIDGLFGGPLSAPATSGPLPSRSLTGLWQLDPNHTLVRVDPDPTGVCPPASGE